MIVKTIHEEDDKASDRITIQARNIHHIQGWSRLDQIEPVTLLRVKSLYYVLCTYATRRSFDAVPKISESSPSWGPIYSWVIWMHFPDLVGSLFDISQAPPGLVIS